MTDIVSDNHTHHAPSPGSIRRWFDHDAFNPAYGGLDLGMVDTSSPMGQVSTNSDQLQYGARAAEQRVAKP